MMITPDEESAPPVVVNTISQNRREYKHDKWTHHVAAEKLNLKKPETPDH